MYMVVIDIVVVIVAVSTRMLHKCLYYIACTACTACTAGAAGAAASTVQLLYSIIQLVPHAI